MKKLSVPGWIKSYFTFFLVNWFIFGVFRVIFLGVFHAALPANPWHELWTTFYIGAKFDFRLAAFLSALLGIYLTICAFWKGARYIHKVIAALYGVLEAVVILVYFADFGHYAYISMRINSSIVKYIENPLISLQMAWETYPVVWGTLALLLCGLIGYFFVLRLLKKAFEKEGNYRWKGKLAWFFVGFAITAALGFGQISQYPLRWSNAYHSTNQFICNLTLNPILNIFDTARFVKADSFNENKTREYYDEVSKFLQVQNPDKEKLSFVREIKDQPAENQHDYNIVIIFMESLAWNKISLTNPDLDPTPFVRELAEKSILFTNFFSPTSATARAVFATVTNIPDVSSYKTNSRNPLVVDQHVIVNALKDYEKYYFIGGSANWGNIRGVLEHNIDNIHMYEEGHFKNEHRNDVWGISDLDLFREANRVLAEEQASDKPFFAIIQTAGYHRPYTIPDDNAGFESIDIGEDLAHKRSFVSVAEYNSLRFSDHALREFFKLAEKSPYYKNTIFFIFGDHGLSAPQSENMPRGTVELNLINHQIPLIIAGAPITKPQVISKTASQVDIFPIAMGLLGRGYKTRAVGRDVLTTNADAEPGALIYAWAHAPNVIGFVQGEYYYHSRGTQEGLYKYTAENFQEDLSAKEPQRFAHMKALAHGLYETSKYSYYHNQKDQTEATK